MGADLWLDEDYKSGVSTNCPGTRFVVDLNTLPQQQQQCCGLLDDDDDEEEKTLPSSMTNNGDEETSSSSTTAEYLDMKGENNNRSEQENINGCCQQEEKIIVEHLPAACENNAVNTTTTTDNPGLENQVEEDNKRLLLVLPEELSVLFVDDDMVLRKLFSRSIKRLQPLWQVHEASSGVTAIRLVDTESYDLIFMDQYMASTEKQLLGTEATRELRAKGVKAKICGLSANHLEKAFLSAGADDFMLKPVPCDKVELEQSLLKLLYGSSN